MPLRLLIAALTLAAVLALAPTARAESGWLWPVAGEVITHYRNGDDPYAAGQHRGIDIAAAVGTPVVAATGGEVRFAATAGSSGLTVSIRTADGQFDTSYLHLSSTAVHKGEVVSSGDRIGAVGTTGSRSAEAAHLHFGVRDAGTEHGYHDPLSLLPPTPTPTQHPRPKPAPLPSPLPVPPRPRPEPAEPGPMSVASPRHGPERAPRPERPHHGPIAHPMPRTALAPGGVAAMPRTAPARGGVAAMPRTAPDRGGVAADGLARERVAPRGRDLERPASEHLREPRGPVHATGPAVASRREPESGPARPAGPAASGPDVGYALACVGLLLAAALLGLTEDGRRATRSGRTRVAAVLRPLVGRR